jgi:hypothetical protein
MPALFRPVRKDRQVVDRPLPFKLPPDAERIVLSAPSVLTACSSADLLSLSCPDGTDGWSSVDYEVPGRGTVIEARVCRVRNGIAVNYVDPYMRRRDPDCLLIGDGLPTDKPRFEERFGTPFAAVRDATLDWLSGQELALFPFIAGPPEIGVHAVALAPRNAAFFAFGLALLQGHLAPGDMPADFSPQAVIYVAPPFRHTVFGGRQVVVHNRTRGLHELFSYNLYPGPSAKKGVYGVLLGLGEKEGWVTAHCSTVQIITPYGNKLTIMHEGASGGGKSEMLEYAHREADGRLLLGTNLVTGQRDHLVLPRGCRLRPVTDDMAACHPSLQRGQGKLSVTDAERAWFVRVDHIRGYGTDPHLEHLTTMAEEPLLFLNIDTVPGSTALIWEHIEDAPGVRCPNPRVVLPRHIVPDVVSHAVSVDVRSFGVRTPPCLSASPTYGILGLISLLPPALAWLWRLTAPRGHENPSIVESEGLSSEGVGSYWPFATGLRVEQANLLLRQIRAGERMHHILCPNQHIGAWHVGFMPQWIAREFLARRGGAWFRRDEVEPARCSLLGFVPTSVMVEGHLIDGGFLRPETQPDVGDEAYDKGAETLADFFRTQLETYLTSDLDPLGRRIIEACLDGADVHGFCDLMPGEMFTED